MKKINLMLLFLMFSATTMWAQGIISNPFTQNSNFMPNPVAQGFPCGTSTTLQFTSGITTASDYPVPTVGSPVKITIGIVGFQFDGTNPATIVTGAYASNFNWVLSTSGTSIQGTQIATLPGTGSNPLFPNPLSSGEIDVALKIPQESPTNTILAVNINLTPGAGMVNNSTSDDNESIQTKSFCAGLSGVVYNDTTTQLNDDGVVNGTPVANGGLDTSSTLTPMYQYVYVTLVNNTTGLVAAIDTIEGNGGYNFPYVTPNNNYSVILSTVPGVPDNTAPPAVLPLAWINTGEQNYNFPTYSDPIANGILSVPVTTGFFTNNNFGVYRAPTSSLPLTLTHFGLSEYNCNVLVSWTTIQELNTSHIDIYRKDNTSSMFTKIGTVPAAGNSSEEKLYSFLDKTVTSQNERYEYYLKFVDLDRQYSQSDVKTIKVKCLENNTSVQVFPNPATNKLNVLYSTQEDDIQVVVDVLDVTGRALLTKSEIVFAGNTMMTFNLESLAAGQYLVRIHSVESNKTDIIKFLKD